MKVVSLFCGCGGLDLGFERAGHQIIWANDLDQNAIETYKNNFNLNETKVILNAIENIESSQIPDCDIVIGGFPCQGFSVANPDLHRRLTVRECARIQTFDDDFIFYGSNGAAYIQIGNAVPPKLAYYLANGFCNN